MTGVCDRTLQNLIDHIGSSLNDLEGTELYRIAIKQGLGEDDPDESLNHIRWSEAFLVSVVNDAFRLLHLERPDLFVEVVDYELTGGCANQPLPEGCSKFAGFMRGCVGSKVPTMMTPTQLVSSQNLSGLFCSQFSHNRKYEIESFGFDPKNPIEFVVSPTPPTNVDLTISLGCVGAAPCYDVEEDLDERVGGTVAMMDTYEIMVIEYALYRAYTADHESESSKEVAKLHWERSMTLIKEGKAADYFFYHPELYLIGPIEEGTGNGVLRNQ